MRKRAEMSSFSYEKKPLQICCHYLSFSELALTWQIIHLDISKGYRTEMVFMHVEYSFGEDIKTFLKNAFSSNTSTRILIATCYPPFFSLAFSDARYARYGLFLSC